MIDEKRIAEIEALGERLDKRKGEWVEHHLAVPSDHEAVEAAAAIRDLLAERRELVAEVEDWRGRLATQCGKTLAMRERAAQTADRYAEQNRRVAAECQRRANRLGDDPFGHGEMAQIGAVEVDAAMREAESIAAAIRELEPPSDD